jgi:hypothetical protein
VIIVTVNKDGLERGDAVRPIRVYQPDGIIFETSSVGLEGGVRVMYNPEHPRQDGARVWIEASRVTSLGKDARVV